MNASHPFIVQRILAAIAALPVTAYGLLVAASQLRLGLDPVGVALGSGALTVAAFCWWFAGRGHIAESRVRMKLAFLGGVLLGGTGFVLGFFGPLLLKPSANQGPLLGILVTSPLGFVGGAVGGWIYAGFRRNKA